MILLSMRQRGCEGTASYISVIRSSQFARDIYITFFSPYSLFCALLEHLYEGLAFA